MTPEASPVSLVQNPAFGSLLVWKFGRGFQVEKAGELPLLCSFFVVLPLILHGPTLREIRSTNLPSGLSKLTSKLSEQRELLFAVHDRVLSMRALTLESIAAGESTRLLSIDYNTSLVRSNDVKTPAPPERLKCHYSSAEKLGRWFARLSLGQAFTLLQIEP